LALGSSEVSLLELTGAYATLAASGRRSEPYAIEMILDAEENAVETHVPTGISALDPLVVSVLTQNLQAVFDEGTARLARPLGFLWPAAGKTGTSENYQDAWFLGYVPELVCGVWVGYDQPKSLGRSGAGIALPIWVAFMKKALALDPPEKFPVPEGLIWKSIDVQSGLLAKSGCPNQRRAAFLRDTEPKDSCPLHAGGLLGLFKRFTDRSPLPPN
jgi:membrane carboxypeptidase/penicillin-binding protein